MENPFKKVFGNLFKKTESSAIGVDIGPSSIKIVQLKKQGGKAVLETYGALSLGPYAGIEVGRATRLPPQKIAEAITDLIREANITTKQSGMSIPMSSSLVTVIQVPNVDQKELAQMIPIEARKYIPISISEVTLDWWVIPKQDASSGEGAQKDFSVPGALSALGPAGVGAHTLEKIDVLLVVIHNDAISQTQEVIKLSSLDTSFFEIEIFSTIRAVLEHEPEPAMIIDMGAGSTKLYIVDRGVLRVSHIVTRGSQDFTLALSRAFNINIDEAEAMKREKGLLAGADNAEIVGIMTSSINAIFTEANRVMLNYQKKYHKNVTKVVLTGGGAMLKGFAELAKKELQTPVVPADPFAKIESPAFLEKILKDAGPEFAVAVGLALRKLQELP